MLECPDCHETFKNKRSLYNHKSREKKNSRNGLPNCAIRKQRTKENQMVREALENTDQREIFQAIHERSDFSSANILLEDLKKQLGNLKKIKTKYETLINLIKKQKITIARPVMTQPRRLEIAASQEWKCNKCLKILSSVFEIDHIVRWTDSYDDSNENLQALCVECHKLKTAEENIK